jgi:hypothetical protein
MTTVKNSQERSDTVYNMGTVYNQNIKDVKPFSLRQQGFIIAYIPTKHSISRNQSLGFISTACLKNDQVLKTRLFFQDCTEKKAGIELSFNNP